MTLLFYIVVRMSIVLDVVHRLGVSLNATAFVKLGLFSFSGGKEAVGKDPILTGLFEGSSLCQWEGIF
jgi:hypothetical protein